MIKILRSLVLAPVVMAAAAFTPNTAMAESTLKVPFTFTVEGKQCPAGLYTVEQSTGRNLVTLRSKDASKSFTWVVFPGDYTSMSSRVVMKFEVTGQDYALESIKYGSQSTSKLNKTPRHSEHRTTQIIAGQ